MNVEQFVLDARELVEKLLLRFKKNKVVLLGHSWGSILGLKLVKRYPDLFHVIGNVGQVVDYTKAEPLSYAYTLEQARKKGNRKAVKELENILPYDYSDTRQNLVERKWLGRFGGIIYGKTGMGDILKMGFKAPESCLADLYRLVKGLNFTMKCMWRPVTQTNFFTEITEVEVPIFFFHGRHDYNTAFTVLEDYYNKLKAPVKELVWFENSGHMPCYEESEKFCSEFASKILPHVVNDQQG